MDKKSKYDRIATETNSAEQLLKAIESRKRQRSEPQSPEPREGYVAPGTKLEQFLADKWQEMFGIEKIGAHDNFLELGIDSVKAAVFLNSLQEELGETVYIITLFDSPTIAGLALYLTDQYPEAVSRVCGPESIEPSRREPDTPTAKAQSPIQPVARKNKNLNQFLEELNRLSDDDVRSLLENERRSHR